MDELMPFLIVAAPLIALGWFLHRRSSHRGKHPLWPAFSATAGVAVFLFAGAVGYNLNAADANAAGTPWSGKVIWWEVAAGIALLPLTAYCWEKGLRSLEPDSAGKVRMAR
jgi:tellurite resistance protein TehA-like permease